MASGCVDSRGWLNFLGLTCAQYELHGWCQGGVALNRSGDVFGYPERSCCACGRQASEPDVSRVEQIVLLATHAISREDARLWGQYASELLAQPSLRAHAWLLLFRGKVSRSPSDLVLRRWRSLGGFVCPWSERDVFSLFPRLPHAIRSSRALNRTRRAHEPAYISHYFWFHASLALWRRWHGEAYAGVRFFWRLEPDVLFSGKIGTLIRWSAEIGAVDVLLPRLYRNDMPSFAHFVRDWERFAGLPLSGRAWSLVCFGRFSARFLSLMEHLWSRGTIGYEEQFLPAACLMAPNCTIAHIGSGLANGTGMIIGASRVRYRPSWSCDDFLTAVRLAATCTCHHV